jgi:hypothetical protein
VTNVFIGAGAGFAGDRTDASIPIVKTLAGSSGPRFLIFETLAERTLALAQVQKRIDPRAGFSPALERFIAPILAPCLDSGIKIVSNFGAANPMAAALLIRNRARRLGYPSIRVAVVEGDDVTQLFSRDEFAECEIDGQMLRGPGAIVSANVYLGAELIAKALDQGADVVVTGRVADPSLVVGPLLHAFQWSASDWDKLGAATLVGHLLECGAQVSGGYFADPGFKDVPDIANVGYPIAEVNSDGAFVITKAPATGGLVNRQTVTEQILYEIHDPSSYVTPDVVLDVTGVEVEELSANRIHVEGAKGRPRTATLKATVCVEAGWLGEAEISYAGGNAVARARLAVQIVKERMDRRAPGLVIRADACGIVSVLGDSTGHILDAAWDGSSTDDVRIRFAAHAIQRDSIDLLMNEVESLYCAGPAGGAGVRQRVAPKLVSTSCLIRRDLVSPLLSFV